MPDRFFRLAALVVALAAAANAQVAILQIHVLEGEGAVYAPGSRMARPLAVEVTDETGKPVEGAAVSFHLPEDGPTGAFGSGLRTAVATTDAAGRASPGSLAVNHVAGRFEIRVIASREQARAGMVAFQYIAEARGAPARAPAARAGRTRWVVVAALAGAAAVAGILAGAHSTTAGTTGTTAAPASPTISIGPPAVTVGKP